MKIIQEVLKFKALDIRKVTNKIVIHHTAGAIGTDVQGIHSSHLSRGWRGIGYHIYTRFNTNTGTWLTYYGRPLHTVGTHARGHNSDSIGISFAGNYEANQPQDELLTQVFEVLRWAKAEYPKAVLTYHRLLPSAATACPGKNLIPHLRVIAKRLCFETQKGF